MAQDNAKESSVGGSALQPHKTYTYAANPSFYSVVPEPYKQYYQNFVREWLAWYDGYVPWLHQAGTDEGIFSTRIAQTVADKLARQITGGNLLFDDGGEDNTETQTFNGRELNAVEFAQRYIKKQRMTPKLIRGMAYALAAGDSIIKLDNKQGELYPTILRKDYYFLDTDFQGNIIAFSALLHEEVQQTKTDSGENYEREFYILEERRFNENGEAQYRKSIKEGQGHRVNYKDNDFHSGDTRYQDLPRGIRERLNRSFPNERNFNEWKPLPFSDLGVYMLKATEGISHQPSLPFGESIFSNAVDILMAYDFFFSSMVTDQYLGRGKVILPRGMEGPNRNDNFYNVLKDMAYHRIPYTNPDEQSPMSIQFDLRADEWRSIRDNLLQQFAMKLGINPRDLATFIVPASEKPSAQEISTDENETALWVESKRDINIEPIQRLLDTLLEFYNYNDSYVEVKFSQKGLSNMNTLVNQTAILKQNNLINEEMAIDRLYPDLSEKQKEKLLNDLSTNKPQQQEEPKEGATVEEENENSFRNGQSQVPNE